MRILGIVGSLRQDSINARLMQVARSVAPAGVVLEVSDSLRALPLFDQDLEGARVPSAVAAFRYQVERADAVLIATPEYNSSVPGPLKNALDWASRPRPGALAGKPVAVISASPSSYGAVWAQEEVRKVVSAMGAETLADGVAVARAHEVVRDGALADAGAQEQLIATVHELTTKIVVPA